jgi:DNA-binding NarL/FixJ family response regulator
VATHTEAFHVLERTVNILLVDNEPCVLYLLTETLQQAGFFRILAVSNAKAASKAIETQWPLHCCILDLGIKDCGNDDLYLVRRYGEMLPFIIYTAREASVEFFDCAAAGARAIVQKDSNCLKGLIKLVAAMRKPVLESILMNRCIAQHREKILPLISLLIEKMPHSVGDWARELNMDERWLRERCSVLCGACPKTLIFLCYAYGLAFDYHETKLRGNTSLLENQVTREQLCRLEEYYFSHRSLLEKFILGAGFHPVFPDLSIRSRSWPLPITKYPSLSGQGVYM